MSCTKAKEKDGKEKSAKSSHKSSAVATGKSQMSSDINTSVYGVLGFSGVGRTSVMSSLAGAPFEKTTKLSQEDEYSPVFTFQLSAIEKESHVQVYVPNTLRVETQISEQPWYNRVGGYFIVFDVTDYDSFRDVEATQWWEDLRKDMKKPVVLIGNHAEQEGQREVKLEVAKKWARERLIPYFDVSAASGKGMKEALDAMTVLERRSKDGYPVRTRQRSFSESESSQQSARSAAH